MRHSYLASPLGAILFLSLSPSAHADTWTVDSAGGGDFTSIQDGIDAAVDGDRVEVLAGSYEGSLDTEDKSIALVGVDGSEATFVVATGVAPAMSIGAGTAVEITGFHLSGGNTVANPNYVGGGIHAVGATVVFNDIVVEDNTAYVGGGAVVYQSDVVMNGAVFRTNFATATAEEEWGQGGGLYGYQSNLNGTDIHFESNTARHGGGLVWVEGSLALDEATFEDNVAEVNGGGAYLRVLDTPANLSAVIVSGNNATYGGGIRAKESGINIEGGLFTGNSAEVGGALRIDGGSVATVQASAFLSNNADYGGALLLESGQADLEKVFFESNSADLLGGAIYVSEATLNIAVADFSQNSAVSDGGAIRAEGLSQLTAQSTIFRGNSGANGGAVHLYQGVVAELNHVTFAGNNASSGGSIRVTDGSNLILRNSIVALAAGGSLLSAPETAETDLSWNNFYASEGSVVSGGATSPVGLNDNLSGDPDFVTFDIENLAGADLRLGAESVSIDAGDPASALDGDGTRADQGAYGGAYGATLESWSWDEQTPGDDDDDDDSAGDDDDSVDDDDDDSAPPEGTWQNGDDCSCAHQSPASTATLFTLALLFGLTGCRRRLSSAPKE